MCVNRKRALRIPFGPVPTAAGGLDPETIALRELPFGLRGNWFAVDEVAPRCAVLAAFSAARGVPAPLADQREAHRLDRLQLAHDPVPTAVSPAAAASPSHRKLANHQWEIRLERLDRRVQRVRHRDVLGAWA